MQCHQQHLSENTYFTGNEISGADIQMSFPLEASLSRGGITESTHPHIYRYVKRLQALPAYLEAVEKGGAYDYSN